MRRVALLAVAAILLSQTSAFGAGRWFRGANQGRLDAPTASTMPANSRSSYAYRYIQGNRMYPKYMWGLHERQIQNIGIPSGDIGLRGNGMTATPW